MQTLPRLVDISVGHEQNVTIAYVCNSRCKQGQLYHNTYINEMTRSKLNKSVRLFATGEYLFSLESDTPLHLYLPSLTDMRWVAAQTSVQPRRVTTSNLVKV